MRELSLQETREISLQSVGLSPDKWDLASIEVLSGALRRTAAFLCPCSSKTLVDAVEQSLKGIIETDQLKENLEHALEGLMSYGDLFEFNDPTTHGEQKRALLYTAPLSFVRRGKGTLFLIGIAVDRPLILPEDIQVQYQGFTRRVAETVSEDLIGLGFVDLAQDVWLKTPPKETAQQYLNRINKTLDGASHAGDIPDMILLDPSTPVNFYPDRWVKVKSQTGRFVARRPQPYGNNLWCYAELKNGHATKFIDLPIGRDRGCDDAWYLQAAIDNLRGKSQKIRVKKVSNDESVIEFFSPIPRWARRRFDIIGRFVDSPGNLFAYALSGDEVEEEVNFALQSLWLEKM